MSDVDEQSAVELITADMVRCDSEHHNAFLPTANASDRLYGTYEVSRSAQLVSTNRTRFQCILVDVQCKLAINTNSALQELSLPVFTPVFTLCGHEWCSWCSVLVNMNQFDRMYPGLLRPLMDCRQLALVMISQVGVAPCPPQAAVVLKCTANVPPGDANMQGWIRNQDSYMKSVTGGRARWLDVSKSSSRS